MMKVPRGSTRDGFDVVVESVVGRVTFGGDGFEPHVAAFHIIAERDEEGRYSFPRENGQRCVVDVAFEGDPA